jgi:hypothetical protein
MPFTADDLRNRHRANWIRVVGADKDGKPKRRWIQQGMRHSFCSYWLAEHEDIDRCNNERLASLESTIETAVSTGYDAVVALPKFVLFQWLAKIFVGVLYKVTAPLDPRELALRLPLAGLLGLAVFVAQSTTCSG